MHFRSLTVLSTMVLGLSSPAMAQLDGWFAENAGGVSWAEDVSFSFVGPGATDDRARVSESDAGWLGGASVGYAFGDRPDPLFVAEAGPVVEPVAQTSFVIFFDWDSAALTAEANQVLDNVVIVASETGAASLLLDGYNDLSGSAAYNLGLQERRANSATDGLIARGVASDEIVVRAFGEENPLLLPDNANDSQNRRIEIIVS